MKRTSTFVELTDPRLSWYGHVSLESRSDGLMPWRIPLEERDLHDPGFAAKAACQSGVRISFHSDTTSIALPCTNHNREILDVPPSDCANLDVVVDGEVHASLEPGGDRYAVTGLPAGRKHIELWLPQWGALSYGSLETDEGVSVEPFDDGRPKWLAYGSSITMCRTAHSPTRTWPAVVAREMGFNLTNFGFGGQCHLDALVARNIRDRDVDFISLCLGINIHGVGSLSARTFRPSTIGFIEIIRERHPLTPLVVMSPIICPDRETTPNAVGLTVVKMRDELEEACGTLRARGDGNIHYVSGPDVFGEEDLAYLPDGLHPSADGYELLGRRFVDRVAGKYFV